MNSVIESRQNEVEKLCAKFKVKRLELFGSLSRDASLVNFGDIDLLVEFENMDYAEHADAYFEFKEELESLFQCEVDLVETRAIKNPYFLESVNKTRSFIYAS
jgi:hypothetical protein